MYFTKYEYRGCLYTDGCLVDRFPATPFNNVTSKYVFGLFLEPYKSTCDDIYQYIIKLVGAMIEKPVNDNFKTMLVPAGKYKLIEFFYTKDDVDTLYFWGFETADNYLKKLM